MQYYYKDLRSKSIIPDDATKFDSFNCGIKKLPELPNGLIELHCDFNKLTKLPKLPNGLVILHCQCNELVEIPELSQSLIKIYCDNNNLVELPELPKTLKICYCSGNKLVELPELPQSLEILHCNDNNIKYLSPHNCLIIKNLKKLCILENPISDGYDIYNSSEFKDNL
jgi:Leucine-rich repeat (LRR) protein